MKKEKSEIVAIKRDLKLLEIRISALENRPKRFTYGTCYCGREIIVKHGIPVCWACSKAPINCNCDEV